MTTDNNCEAKTLKELLKERSINKSELVRKMGIGRDTLTKWESGAKVPSFVNAVKLASELNISLKTLAVSFGYDTARIPPDEIDPDRSTLPPKDRSGGENN